MTAIIVATLILAIQMPTISGDSPENFGYSDVATPVIPTSMMEEYHNQR